MIIFRGQCVFFQDKQQNKEMKAKNMKMQTIYFYLYMKVKYAHFEKYTKIATVSFNRFSIQTYLYACCIA